MPVAIAESPVIPMVGKGEVSGTPDARAENPSGMLYRTRVGESPHGGCGIFAAEPIPAGANWWRRLDDVNTLRITRGQYAELMASDKSGCSGPMCVAIPTYTFYSKRDDCLLLALDNSRFVNHSDTPNSQYDSQLNVARALRDIAEGEEILENYTHYDAYCWPESWDEHSEAGGHVSAEARAAYLAEHPENPILPNPMQPLKTYVADAGEIKGCGLFLGVDVTAETLLWEQTDTNVLVITRAAWKTFAASEHELSELSRGLYRGILVYAYYEATVDSLFLCLDNARFINHDGAGTTYGDATTLFRRDAKAGEEITDDYLEYDVCEWAVLEWERPVGYFAARRPEGFVLPQ